MTDAPSPPATLTVKVDPPVEYGGQSYSELVLREPTVEQMEACDALNGTAWNRGLVAQVAGVPDKVVGKLGIRTLNTASSYLVGFTGAVLPTAT